MPLQLRHGYAADPHHGLPIDDINRPRSSRCQSTDAHCNPAHVCQVWGWWVNLRGFHMLVHCRYTFLSCSPSMGPSDSTDPPRLCQGCLPPFPMSSRVRLPSASTHSLRRVDGRVLSPRHGLRRLVALDVGDPNFKWSLGHVIGLGALTRESNTSSSLIEPRGP